MSDDKNNNVIQFPGRKKEESVGGPGTGTPETAVPATTPAAPATAPKAKSRKGAKSSKKTLAGTVLAIVLATGAVNRFTFDKGTPANSASYRSNETVQRGLASTEKLNWNRDAKWERTIAEKLASPHVREIASTRIGRNATPEEKLRWGTLEEKYTINYQPDHQVIQTISLQDKDTPPSYILDRAKFLKEYGLLFESNFKGAKLKSVESTDEKIVEAYTIFDKKDRPKGEARFELDRHKRLISLKVEPVQI